MLPLLLTTLHEISVRRKNHGAMCKSTQQPHAIIQEALEYRLKNIVSGQATHEKIAHFNIEVNHIVNHWKYVLYMF